MANVQLLKADKDFSKEVDKLLPEAQDLAKVGCYELRSPFCITDYGDRAMFKLLSRSY